MPITIPLPDPAPFKFCYSSPRSGGCFALPRPLLIIVMLKRLSRKGDTLHSPRYSCPSYPTQLPNPHYDTSPPPLPQNQTKSAHSCPIPRKASPNSRPPHPQNQTETAHFCPIPGKGHPYLPGNQPPSPKTDRISPIPSDSEESNPALCPASSKSDKISPFLSDSEEGISQLSATPSPKSERIKPHPVRKRGETPTHHTTWLTYGRFGQLRTAKWLIYGTQIAISQVWGAELQRSYSQYSGFGAIYKPLSETRTPESAIHKRNSSQQRPIRSRYHSNSRPAAPYNPIPNLFPGPTPGIPQDPAPTYRISRSALSSELDRIWRIGQNLAISVRKRGRGPPRTSRIRQNQPNPVRKTGSGGRTPLSPAPASPKSDRNGGLLSENEEEEEENARPPRNRTETGGFCLKTGKERPCQP